jgi:hypothetical protein
LGHQTKTHVKYILYKDINNKIKQNYPNYQMQMMLLKPVLCFIQQQEVVESQQIGDQCVGQSLLELCTCSVCQYSAGVYLQSSYLQVFLL